MEQAMVEALQAVIQPNQCNLCEVKLADSNIAKIHYSSKQHNKNLLLFESVVMKTISSKQNQAQNTLQNASTKTALASKKHEKDVQKELEDQYCEACNIQTASKQQMWNHLRNVSHQNRLKQLGLSKIDGQYSPFCSNLPYQLKGQMLSDACNICGDSFPTLKRALGHYLSPKHETAVCHWFKEQRQTKKMPDKPRTYKCYICNISLDTKAEKDQHVQSFPHSDLAKLKSELVKKGLDQQFWLLRGSTVVCEICNAKLLTTASLTSHFKSNRHSDNYDAWLVGLPPKKVISKTRTKWYYCQVCDKGLDGTTESEKHYQAPPHISKGESYCPICKIRVSSPEALKLHNTFIPHLENLKKFQKEKGTKDTTGKNTPVLPQESSRYNIISLSQNDKQPNKMSQENSKHNSDKQTNKYKIIPLLQNDKQAEKSENVFKLRSGPLQTNPSLLATESKVNDPEASKQAKNLKEEVFNELEKLIQKLYYSKQVPYEVSLKYLKRVNQEVEELSKQIQIKAKSDLAEDPQTNVAGPDEAAASTTHIIHHEGPCLAEDLLSFYPEHALSNDEADDFKNSCGKINDPEYVPCEATNLTKDEPAMGDSQNTVPVPLGFNNTVSYNSCYNKTVTADQQTEISMLVPKNSSSHSSSVNLNENSTVEINKDENPESITDEEQKPRNISELLEKIVKRSEEVELEFPNEPVVEKQVLFEITILLKQIMADGMPFEQTFECLRNFNKRLDENIDIPDQQKEEMLESGAEYETQQEYIFISISQGKALTTHFKEKLIKLGPDQEEKRMKLGAELEEQSNDNSITSSPQKAKTSYSTELLDFRPDPNENLMELKTEDELQHDNYHSIYSSHEKTLKLRPDQKEKLIELGEELKAQQDADNSISCSQQKVNIIHSMHLRSKSQEDLLELDTGHEAQYDKYNSSQKKAGLTYSKEELLQLRPEQNGKLMELGAEQKITTTYSNEILQTPYIKEELLEVDDYNNSIPRSQQEARITYSKEELLKLRPELKEEVTDFEANQEPQQCGSNSTASSQQPIKNNTYSKEDLLKLRTEDTFAIIIPQLAMKLISVKIWKGRVNRCELTAAEGCPTSVYNYYVKSDFVQFMDFWEAYLQMSVDDLLVEQSEPGLFCQENSD